MKAKAPKSPKLPPNPSCPKHFFASPKDGKSEVPELRDNLLTWYDKNKRVLPWRSIAENERDDNVRGYSVWVSEIMLQQTQVATVIEYYKRWMGKWPNTKSLSSATLEEVNEMWSGLGYYSRGRRLWEGAKKVEGEMEGEMPKTAERLLKELPGVGRYTASAVASIAYKIPVGLVDGNVIRVLTRMRTIGAESTAAAVTEALWKNANEIVAPDRPGDFNQALMELGATVCTPKNPSCISCPVSDHCLAYQEVKRHKDENKNKLANVKTEDVGDIEDIAQGCALCLPASEPYVSSDGVMNYPRKGKKAAVREETSLVIIPVHEKAKGGAQYLLYQRPKTGLLANLLEFPSFPISSEEKVARARVKAKVANDLSLDVECVESLGSVFHQFSHIKQTYEVWLAKVASLEEPALNEEQYQKFEVLTEEEIDKSAISTAMKKVFNARKSQGVAKKGTKRPLDTNPSQQRSISSFFSPSAKKKT